MVGRRGREDFVNPFRIVVFTRYEKRFYTLMKYTFMRKLVFFLIPVLVASIAAKAQVDTTKYEYCQVEVIGKLKGSKAKISVDFGQFQSIFSKAYKDKITGKVADFNSPMDALNYMVGVE